MARRKDQAARREHLISATLETIAAHGLAGATMKNIAETADISPRLVAYYYPEPGEPDRGGPPGRDRPLLLGTPARPRGRPDAHGEARPPHVLRPPAGRGPAAEPGARRDLGEREPQPDARHLDDPALRPRGLALHRRPRGRRCPRDLRTDRRRRGRRPQFRRARGRPRPAPARPQLLTHPGAGRAAGSPAYALSATGVRVVPQAPTNVASRRN
ncbi:TetR family transcriptional regulator [Nocardioides sp. W3-2-3]|uniref:TetR family transcriptional regulator n=1 Tax=Nocardioides convexus TaxID=2712224 RepID=UPI002418A3BB|nr:TetR family transcriptional regulator [Nocardioides convexus]NGZ99511.1 TetR family transcriptional regulator [Nocardioides convexus]